MGGVKRLSKKDLEKKALEILSRYDPKYLRIDENQEILLSRKELDIEGLIEGFYDLSIDYKKLSTDGSILGITSFGESLFPVISEENKIELIRVNDGDIIIDSNLLEGKNEGRIRFTMAHEISHWILHKELFSNKCAEKLNRIIVSKDTEEGRLTYDLQCKTDEEWVEWQADYLAGALLMPYTLFKYYFDIIRKELDIKQGYLYLDKQKCNIDNFNYAITRLSGIFGTSKLATKVRMCKLGFLKEDVELKCSQKCVLNTN